MDREAFLKKVLSAMSDACIAYDNQGTITECNAAAERIFGIHADEVVGKKFEAEGKYDQRLSLFLAALFPSRAPAMTRRTEAGIVPPVIDVSFDSPEAELRITILELFDASKTRVGFARLVSDRTKEVNSTKSKTDFITVASHQLRTPLTAIHWSFDMLSKANLPPDQVDLVRTGALATEDLLETVDYLLDAARIEEGKFDYRFEETDLQGFLQNLIDGAKLTAKKYDVVLRGVFPEARGVRIMADQKKLGVALLNLIDNAMKYNQPKGEVVVELECFTDRPYVKVHVKDTGLGIGERDIEKIFTKFFRAEGVKKIRPDGTGLGLYITRNIILGHGGDIRVSSTLGKGTTFSVTLPLYTAPRVEVRASEKSSA